MSLNIAIIKARDLTVKGGAERAVLELAKNFNCDIFTSNYDPASTYKEFSNLNIYFSPIKWKIEHLLFLKFINFPFIKQLREYDLIIATDGFFSKLVALHNDMPPIIYYAQSPPPSFRGFMRPFNIIDIYATKRIKMIVSNSQTLRKRILARYGRDSRVVYPPVNIKKFYNKESEDFFLSVQRITPVKRVHIQIEAFKSLPHHRLIIVGGSYEPDYFDKLKRMAPSNVEFRINVEEKELLDLYARCKATICTTKNEDFGLGPVESMAAGKPCIAVNEGGFKETIIHGKTGILINEPYVKDLIKAILEFDNYYFDPKVLMKTAENFSSDKFIMNFKKIFYEIIKN